MRGTSERQSGGRRWAVSSERDEAKAVAVSDCAKIASFSEASLLVKREGHATRILRALNSMDIEV
jgi:hypothetical protein